MLVRIEKKLLRPGNSESTTARLVLQTGSRAGLEAPLQYGYYMIGRHQECQIRPKSRSVSRCHCLLQHEEGALRVLDLESTSGTRINEEKLTPKTWMSLSDGDMLRCGKIVFLVSVQVNQRQPTPKSVATVGAAAGSGSSMLSSEPWKEVDIADYLGSEDDADRERRYESIREHSESRPSHESSDPDEEVDIFNDDFDEDSSPLSSPEPVNGSSVQVESPRMVGAANPSTAKKQPNAEPKPPRQRPVRPPKQKRKNLAKSGPRGLGSWGDIDRVKMIGAILLTVIAVGYLGYSGYRYYSGPNVRVLEGID